MAWIESHQQLKDHPKVFDLMFSMGWDLDQTIGKLHRFWWWCVDYAEDGDLRKHSDERLARAVGLNSELSKQFVEAMVASCWIDREPYFRVHEWWHYVGRFLNGKYSGEPERWKQVRDSYSNPTVTRRKPSLPNLTKPNLTKPNQKYKGAFKKPTLEDVKAAFKGRGVSPLNAEAFIDHHEARGWILSNGRPMRSLGGAVGTWIRNGKLFGTLVTQEVKNDEWDRPFPISK